MGAQEIGLWRGQLTLPTFAAPAYERALVGASAIRDWCKRWRQRD